MICLATEASTRPCSRRARGERNPQSELEYCSVLRQIHQDVLSALVNLKVPYNDALNALQSAKSEHAGESFDELFRLALASLNAGKSRRVA